MHTAPTPVSHPLPIASSAEPFQRPDHKAKRHPRPKKWTRREVRRQCEAAIARALGVAL